MNAVLGLVVAHDPNGPEAELLRSIQNDLFDVGADLCLPATAEEQVRSLAEFLDTTAPGETPVIVASGLSAASAALTRSRRPLSRSTRLPAWVSS